MAQVLAEKATNNKERTWQQIVLQKYHWHGKIFSEEASEIFPEPQQWNHAIDLKGSAPTSTNCRVYPLLPKEKEEQGKFLAANLQLGQIRWFKSLYASKFFLIKKKDRKYRPIQNYQNLNKWTILNKYLLPLIAELVYNLAGKKLFSRFDVQWGYNNIHIKEGNKWKAAFKISEGLFEPTVMFFGLTNSLATFQTMMDDIFCKEIAQGWLRIYMDDILIAMESSLEDHKLKVHYILDKLEPYDLFLKPKKCSFGIKEVEYLRVIIGNGSMKMDPVKAEGITNWLIPKNSERCAKLPRVL